MQMYFKFKRESASSRARCQQRYPCRKTVTNSVSRIGKQGVLTSCILTLNL